MNKREIFSHFSHILDNMLENSYFFPTWAQDLCPIEDIDGRIVNDTAVPSNIDIRIGATRACIIDSDYNYVVKFDVDEDGSTGSACEHEYEIYNSARTEGFSRYFAEVEYLGTYTKTIMFYNRSSIEKHISLFEYGSRFDEEFEAAIDEFEEAHPITINIPLYAYAKADHAWRIISEEEEERCLSIAKSINSPMRQGNLNVAAIFIAEYGADEYFEVSAFLEENHVNDLHFGNVGTINGDFCFIDYAGYWEYGCYEEEE